MKPWLLRVRQAKNKTTTDTLLIRKETMNKKYLDWLEEISDIKAERTQRQYRDLRKIMFSNDFHPIFDKEGNPVNADAHVMVSSNENYETDQELSERIWSF